MKKQFSFILLFYFFMTPCLNAELVSFAHEGYVSDNGYQSITKKANSSKIGKYRIYIEYTLLARWKTEFLLGDPVLYADYIYSIDKISIHVDDISSVYYTMGIDTMDYLLTEKESSFFKSLVRIPSAKVRVIFHPEYDSVKEEILIDGGVGAKHYGGKENIYIDTYDRYTKNFQIKAFWSVPQKMLLKKIKTN